MGEIVKVSESRFDGYAAFDMSNCGRGAVSKESTRTVPTTKISINPHTDQTDKCLPSEARIGGLGRACEVSVSICSWLSVVWSVILIMLQYSL